MLMINPYELVYLLHQCMDPAVRPMAKYDSQAVDDTGMGPFGCSFHTAVIHGSPVIILTTELTPGHFFVRDHLDKKDNIVAYSATLYTWDGMAQTVMFDALDEFNNSHLLIEESMDHLTQIPELKRVELRVMRMFSGFELFFDYEKVTEDEKPELIKARIHRVLSDEKEIVIDGIYS